MVSGQEFLLIGAVVGVGVLHTMVPDHWAPIALLARQRGWSRAETARTALQAGGGHVATTLLLGLAAWLAGAGAAERFGHAVDALAAVALVGFGAWIAIGSWREIRATAAGTDHHRHHPDDRHDEHHHHGEAHRSDHGWEHDPLYAPSRGVEVMARHVHLHRHDGTAHAHWHDHSAGTVHAIAGDVALFPPLHHHRHKTTGRMALLLVLGSSPMVEGIPAFFAAARYGVGFIAIMSVAFALSTIATYVFFSVQAASGLQRLRFGPVERYGEVISGAFIATMGLVFFLWSVA